MKSRKRRRVLTSKVQNINISIHTGTPNSEIFIIRLWSTSLCRFKIDAIEATWSKRAFAPEKTMINWYPPTKFHAETRIFMKNKDTTRQIMGVPPLEVPELLDWGYPAACPSDLKWDKQEEALQLQFQHWYYTPQ